MTDIQAERIRGAEAKQLMENKLLKEAFDAAEQSILSQMDEVKMRDIDMHTRLIQAKQILNSVKTYLYRVIETGDLADLQINEPKLFRNPFKR